MHFYEINSINQVNKILSVWCEALTRPLVTSIHVMKFRLQFSCNYFERKNCKKKKKVGIL